MVTMGQVPDYNSIVNASNNNPDGFGYAIHYGDRIVTSRGMNAQKTIDKFFDALDGAGTDFVAMYHARITTHGDSIIENAHPFRVGGRKDIILGHNGMLPIHPKKGDRRSDTRIFAEDILPSLGVESLDNNDSFKRLEGWAAGSKLAILTNAPELRDSVYIVNEHLGDWDQNVWWSNSSYKHSYTFYGSGYYSRGLWSSEDLLDADRKALTAELEEVDYTCYVCMSQVTEEGLYDGVCTVCNSCLECYDHAVACMCYNPTVAQHNYNGMTMEMEY
jgi:glutamine amidotransferase